MTARWLFRVALLINLAAAAANADEPPARVFHIGIVAGLPRSSPEHAAFEERMRELGYVEGRNHGYGGPVHPGRDQGGRFRPAGKRLHRQPFPSGRKPDRGGL